MICRVKECKGFDPTSLNGNSLASNGKFSKPLGVTCDIPVYGSYLGPLLFLVDYNSFEQSLHISLVGMNADRDLVPVRNLVLVRNLVK